MDHILNLMVNCNIMLIMNDMDDIGYIYIFSSMQQFEKLGWMRKAERGRKLTKKGRQFMDEFSGRVQRSKMVSQYYKRLGKEEKARRKAARAQRRARQQKRQTAGGPSVTTGGNQQNRNYQSQV